MDFNQYESVEEPVHNGSLDINDSKPFMKCRLIHSQEKDLKTPIKSNKQIGLTSYQDYNSSTISYNANMPSCARVRIKTLARNYENDRTQSEARVLFNFSPQVKKKNTDRCATEQSSASFADKFCWKSIPDNLFVRRKYTLEINKKQLNLKTTNNNLLRPAQKAFTMTQTKVSTNGFQSTEISKQIQVEQPLLKLHACSPDTQPSIPDNQYLTYFEALKSTKLREHEIQQVESITRSRMSQRSIENEENQVKQFVLDESFIYWTYQAGFQNPLDNLVSEKQA